MPALPATPALHTLLCDTHVHTFEPARFPYAPERRFTPPTASVADLQWFHREHAVARTVLVQPSVYGQDHRCLLNSLQTLGERARGVAVLGPQTTAQALSGMAQLGVCGHRVNLAVDRVGGVDDAVSAGRRVAQSLARAPGGWHLQLHAGLAMIAELAPQLKALRQTVVIDHFGLPQAALGTLQAGWRALLDLVGKGHVYVKLSAPYMGSVQGPLYADMQAFVMSLAEAAPSRLLWGSNWPHTRGSTRDAQASAEATETFRTEDDRSLRLQLQAWLGPAVSQQVFVDNPARLYRFANSFTNPPPAPGEAAPSWTSQ